MRAGRRKQNHCIFQKLTTFQTQRSQVKPSSAGRGSVWAVNARGSLWPGVSQASDRGAGGSFAGAEGPGPPGGQRRPASPPADRCRRSALGSSNQSGGSGHRPPPSPGQQDAQAPARRWRFEPGPEESRHVTTEGRSAAGPRCFHRP